MSLRRHVAELARQRWQARHVGITTPELVADADEQAVYRILNFALRAGAIMLASGAGTAEVESTILELTAACGLATCEVDVTFTSLTVSYLRGVDVEPVTTLQVVRQRRVNYGRLSAVQRLREDVVARRTSPDEAIVALDAIMALPSRRGTVVVFGWAGMAAAFAVLLGGAAIVGVVAFVSTCFVYLAGRRLTRRGIPAFFVTALGAAIATGFAIALVAAHVSAKSNLVVAGGIMVLVPGYALVASVQDALTGFPISAGARGLEVLITATGIITGVAAVLYLAASTGLHVRLGASISTSLTDLPFQVVAAGVASALYALATSVPRRMILGSAVAGAFGWGLFLSLLRAGVSDIVATALAAVAVGLLGQLLAERLRTHPFLFLVPGVMPLVPGLTIYQGMLDLFYHNRSGTPTLLQALVIGLAIASGVTLGSMALRPMHRRRRSHGLT